MSYKYCVVPKCKNTSVNTPDKLFFQMPKDTEERKKWCVVMKRTTTKLSSLSHRHCCEDHFDLETDMENYIKFKLMGGKVTLKKGVLPHKFACQNEPEPILNVHIGDEYNILMEPVERRIYEEECNDPLFDPGNGDEVSNLKVVRSDNFIDNFSAVTSSSSQSGASEEVSTDLEINEHLFKEHMQKTAVMAVSREPELLTGIPKHSKFCLEHLQSITKLQLLKICLTLRKIRLCEHNSILAIYFGLSESSVCKYFNDAVPKIATCMRELVFFPSADDIRNNLPIPFRQHCSRITSVIDCFEVQIEKPSKVMQQTLTWSHYKNCNTIKYLISNTPDGLINFVSEGYGGNTSISTIFEDCGFLEKLPKGSQVLADTDRATGFKNIEHLLRRRDCHLVKPSFVNSNFKSTTKELSLTKRIEKLRHFKIIGHHARVDTANIHLLDDLVVIACGIVNLQSC